MPKRVAVEDIYDAAFDDQALQALATDLARSFDARSALIHWVHKDGTADILSHSGYFTDEQLAVYATQFASIDPWIAATAGPEAANRVHDLEEAVPVAEFTASEFYNAYVRAMGDDTCRGLGIRLEAEHGSGFVVLQRGLTQQSFESSAKTALLDYANHLTRMLAIRGKLAIAERKCADLSVTFDALALAAFVVDADLRVRHVNRAAEVLLRRAHGLRLCAGTLTAGSTHADRSLRDLVSAVLKGGPAVDALRISLPSGEPIDLSIIAAPVVRGAPAALIIAGTAVRDDTRIGRLRSLYRLSKSEAELATLLADGLSPADIAVARHVSIGTVRNQIKQIAAKLECQRQSDIVRIVASLPALLS